MAKSLSQVAIATDTFLAWVQKTNYAINAIATECLTANTDANGAVTVGNSFLNGIFSSNVVAVATLRGGNVQSSDVLSITSNAVFSGAQINASSNVYITGSNLHITGKTTTTGNLTFKSNSTFTVLTLTGNTTAKAITANADVTISGNVSISQNVDSINFITANVATTNLTRSNNITANTTVTANIYIGNTSFYLYNDCVTINTTGTSAQLVTSYSIDYTTAKLLINVRDQNANSVLGSEILIINDGGTTVYSTEYAILASNGIISTFTSNANSTMVRLYATPTVANTTVKISRTLMN